MKLLIANRGEIAIRIMRAAAELGIETVGIYTKDDAQSLHTGKADSAVEIDGVGAAGYLNIDRVVAIAQQSGCDAVHPGYGFLSENPVFANRCVSAGLNFIGPKVEIIELFGDKARARLAAVGADVPVTRGIDRAVSLGEATDFFDSLGGGRAIMIKAIAGGGGRGSRVVHDRGELSATFERCQSEADLAFGNSDVYVEEFITRARHIEIQILGDKHGHVAHLGERECSVQRRFQKLIEIAPAPFLDPNLRTSLIEAAVRCAESVGYENAGTFEFLVDNEASADEQSPYAFIEANARLQVEHTVTESVTGVDIVQAQLKLAQGASISELGLSAEPLSTRGFAIQARVCMETVGSDGSFQPTAGTLTAYEAPNGPGVRTDGFGYTGYPTSLSFDSLLAKVIVHSRSEIFSDAVRKTQRALSEFRIEGVETNIDFLQNILSHNDFARGDVHTRFVDDELSRLIEAPTERSSLVAPISGLPNAGGSGGFAGARVEDAADPLALFKHDTEVKSVLKDESIMDQPRPVKAKDTGRVVSIMVSSGDAIASGEPIAVIDTLGLRHVIVAEFGAVIDEVLVAPGDELSADQTIVLVSPKEVKQDVTTSQYQETGEIREDLLELNRRRAYIYDDARSEKVERRHEKGQQTARENIEQLLDPESFREYGPLVTASSWQKQEWLRQTTPTDGMIMGIGSVNGDRFSEERSRVAVAHYDYMVVAGTQGGRGHYKQDRLFEMARRFRMPLILFAEGGGGRPGISGGESAERKDTGQKSVTGADAIDKAAMTGGGVGMDTWTFTEFSFLSGLVPLVGVNSGRCFAGNTALLACCDVIIAAKNSTIAMGGPAMIEGGGLGIYTPEEVGPMSFQVPNGVVDILVEDDAAAVETAKKYISYFQGALEDWNVPNQALLRQLVPMEREGIYDMRSIIHTLCDKDSILEIREAFGPSLITALIRIEGRPMGLIANNPQHYSGAIDSDAADKGARFLQLCDTFDLPVLSLIDCPGTRLGQDQEERALVRHFARLLTTGANISVPIFCVIVRKAYGMGALAMAGGSSLTPLFTIGWPTAELSAQSPEGLAKLSAKAEQEGEDLESTEEIYDSYLSTYVEESRAVNSGGTNYGIDDVVDPIDTRSWISQGLKSVPSVPVRQTKKRPNMDTW